MLRRRAFTSNQTRRLSSPPKTTANRRLRLSPRPAIVEDVEVPKQSDAKPDLVKEALEMLNSDSVGLASVLGKENYARLEGLLGEEKTQRMAGASLRMGSLAFPCEMLEPFQSPAPHTESSSTLPFRASRSCHSEPPSAHVCVSSRRCFAHFGWHQGLAEFHWIRMMTEGVRSLCLTKRPCVPCFFSIWCV